MITLWETLIYEPLYNALLYISSVLPGSDIGLGVVVLTIIVRIILMPLSKKMIRGQFMMRKLEPKIKAIKDKKLSKEEEAKKIFELYKEEKINPFSGCLLLLIQLPILIALYSVFARSIIQPEHIYSFISADGLNILFLGAIDISVAFLPFAIAAGIIQSIQAFLTPIPQSSDDDKSFQAQISKSMVFQTRYVLPIIIIFFASKLSAAVSLYWIVGGLFSIGQELYFRKKYKETLESQSPQ
jgi:YidC/Oxa1 family membrane protein insertase